mgnify:CR=1 FL=1
MISKGLKFASEELPPRARRIRNHICQNRLHIRTTSACAENTPRAANASPSIWNYLRVRGEYLSHDSLREILMELPPRARRIPDFR